MWIETEAADRAAIDRRVLEEVESVVRAETAKIARVVLDPTPYASGRAVRAVGGA